MKKCQDFPEHLRKIVNLQETWQKQVMHPIL